ncbi:hypothetical protein MNB_SUP05-SYMBIONT-4-672 [hydrothermal vent metagenome]|uniref:Uncharacterized protein n=1 Tax=hydrothermal vent metagenome TaxID=652676 RepID=A0A1W1DYY9_9ZZZZ
MFGRKSATGVRSSDEARRFFLESWEKIWKGWGLYNWRLIWIGWCSHPLPVF